VFAFSRRRLLPFGFESYAEDVVQDVFVDVIKSFSKFDPATGPFFPRLWKIVRNTLHDHIHKDRVRLREVPLPDNTEAEGAGGEVQGEGGRACDRPRPEEAESSV